MADFCPNCKAEIKSGFLSSNKFVEELKSRFINKFTDNAAEKHCDACAMDLVHKACTNFVKIKKEHVQEVTSSIGKIPILTIHDPHDWKYKALGIVTAQSVTGTGVIAEVSSGFTDFFGMQSNTYNKKLAEGELRCMNMLRSKTLALGGNAIIGTDIDYSEAGGLKGMLMVCMAGTAVKLENLEVLSSSPDAFSKLEESGRWMEEAQIYSPLLIGYVNE